jgi:hypothetical protein
VFSGLLAQHPLKKRMLTFDIAVSANSITSGGFLRIFLKNGKKKKYTIIYYAAFLKLIAILRMTLPMPITTKNFFNYNSFANYTRFLFNLVEGKTLIYRFDKNPKNLKQEIKYIGAKKRIGFLLKKIFLSLNTLTNHNNLIDRMVGVIHLHETNYTGSYTAAYKKLVYAQFLKSKKRAIT